MGTLAFIRVIVKRMTLNITNSPEKIYIIKNARKGESNT